MLTPFLKTGEISSRLKYYKALGHKRTQSLQNRLYAV